MHTRPRAIDPSARAYTILLAPRLNSFPPNSAPSRSPRARVYSPDKRELLLMMLAPGNKARERAIDIRDLSIARGRVAIHKHCTRVVYAPADVCVASAGAKKPSTWRRPVCTQCDGDCLVGATLRARFTSLVVMPYTLSLFLSLLRSSSGRRLYSLRCGVFLLGPLHLIPVYCARGVVYVLGRHFFFFGLAVNCVV